MMESFCKDLDVFKHHLHQNADREMPVVVASKNPSVYYQAYL